MFDAIQFEKKVYAAVTKEVNTAFQDENGRKKFGEGMQILRQIIAILHSITAETIIQTFYGLTMGRVEDQG